MNNINLLVIDDEPSNIQVIVNLMKAAGHYKVISASNGLLGLELAIQSKPDIILTDWEMPDLNGIGIIRELKKNDTVKDIPVIMVTGVHTTSGDLKNALEAGAFDYIRKPIDGTELIARVNSALRFMKEHRAKIENEKIIAKMQEDKRQEKIESQKRELLSKIMILQKMDLMHEELRKKLNAVDSEKKCQLQKSDCEVYGFASKYANEILKSGNEQIWNELDMNFENIQKEFYQKILNRFPGLTQNERRLCGYLRLNLSTKDISSLSNQSTRSIEIARTRLREKLGLKGTEEELHIFLLGF